jgi:hypothetical protein
MKSKKFKVFLGCPCGSNPIKLFTAVILFVPGKSFQPSLMFAGKAIGLP